MDLTRAVQAISGALSVAPEKCDASWAYSCCAASRIIHECVWESQPKAEQVEEILPLLEEVKRQMPEIPRKGKYGKYIDAFSDNIGLRIKNLRENYLGGKPSAFAPASLLEQVEEILREAEGSDMSPEELLAALNART